MWSEAKAPFERQWFHKIPLKCFLEDIQRCVLHRPPNAAQIKRVKNMIVWRWFISTYLFPALCVLIYRQLHSNIHVMHADHRFVSFHRWTLQKRKRCGTHAGVCPHPILKWSGHMGPIRQSFPLLMKNKRGIIKILEDGTRGHKYNAMKKTSTAGARCGASWLRKNVLTRHSDSGHISISLIRPISRGLTE